jgi:chloride channel protein, CIC family
MSSFVISRIKKIVNILLEKFLSWKEGKLKPRQFVYLLSLLVGIIGGLSAVVLKNLVHYLQYFLLNYKLFENLNYLYLLFPLVGILLTALYIKYFVKDNINHGISKILYAISKNNAILRKHNTYSSLISSTLTVGFGGSVGLEAPIVLTGSSIGSTIAQFFKMDYKTKVLLIGCGAAGAIAGIFKAPVAAVIFSLEVLMLDLTMWSLVPLLISAVSGFSVAYFFLGRGEIFKYQMTFDFLMKNIPWYIILGVFTGIVSFYFTKTNRFVEAQFKKIQSEKSRWLIGGLLLGVIILFLPPLYGEGYNTLGLLLNGNQTEITQDSLFAGLSGNFSAIVIFLILIIVFKAIATAITTGAGGIGGVFAPSLFLGGISGYLVAMLLQKFSFIHISQRNFSLVGMAGVMAGVMHAPLTAIFLIAEITGGYGLFIPLMITSTISYITIMYFEPHSIYHMRLAERGELITHHKDQAILTLIDMSEIIETDFVELKPEDKLQDLINAISHTKRNLFPVVKNKYLIGIVLLDDIRHLIFNTELYNSISIRDIMYSPPAIVDPKEPMDEVLKKFEDTKSWNLPVIHNGEYLGFISKSTIFSVYRNWLINLSGEE